MALPAAAAQIYFNDFEGAVGSEWSNTSTATTPVGARKFLGQFVIKNAWDTVSLTLNSVPSSDVTVSFDLFIIGSWDGNSTTNGPDRWEFSIAGGPTLLSTTFANSTNPAQNQAFPDAYPGGNHPGYTGAVEHGTLGYASSKDAVYHLSYTFAHAAGPLVANFSGFVNGSDETFGLDNVSVSTSVSTVVNPEPSSLLLLGSGLLGVGLWTRMRRSQPR